jgi:hypothetical protein
MAKVTTAMLVRAVAEWAREFENPIRIMPGSRRANVDFDLGDVVAGRDTLL